MVTTKSHQEKTAADKTSLGFDYQYYYFLYILLTLKKGQKIGYEVKEDVHIDLDKNKVILMQLKHTLKTNVEGKPVNLTERDTDLWKTLHNWINLINDKNEGRNSKEKQLEFISNSKFILVSNKAQNTRNKFLVKVQMFNNEEISLDQFRNYLIDLESNTKVSKNNKNKQYMKELIKQDSDWLEKFISKLDFDLDEDNLITKIRQKIIEDHVSPDRVEEVFAHINNSMNIWKFKTVKNNGKLEISFDKVNKILTKCYEIGRRSNKLPKRDFKIKMPKDFSEQKFIKELLEIEDLEENDEYLMLEFTKFKIHLVRHIETWYQDGLISGKEIKDFNKDCIYKWINIHRKSHRKSNRIKGNDKLEPCEKIEKINDNSLNCLDEIRSLNLKLDETDLETELSNGQFYLLSDENKIGWKLEWEDKYKK